MTPGSRPPPVPIGAPLAQSHEGEPLLFPALGAVLHLEPLLPDDEPRLEMVNELVWTWFGHELRFVNKTFESEIARARRADADYIAAYPKNLVPPAATGANEQALLSHYAQWNADDFEVAFNGGADEVSASPYSYRFWAEVPEPDDQRLAAYGVIHITVPEAWPLHDFHEKICKIAAAVRLRWGAAGLTYSPWMASGYEVPSAKMAAHARRYVGYDIPEYYRLVAAFHQKIRSVSWLTFLGPSLVAELAAAGRQLQPSHLLNVYAAGPQVVVQAGAQPASGDRNRLIFPPAYVEADALLRPVRARDGAGLEFLGPWDDKTVTDWLRRFEKRVN